MSLRFDHDDNVLDIINKINKGLYEAGPEFQVKLHRLNGDFEYITGEIVLSDELIQY